MHYILGHISFFTYRSLKAISKISDSINRVLHGDERIDFDICSEGELDILQSEVYKMTVRLRSQQQSLMNDKVYLANSIADISHQIRTPLTSINLLASTLSKLDLTEKKAHP